jgi:tight adherence protein B
VLSLAPCLAAIAAATGVYAAWDALTVAERMIRTGALVTYFPALGSGDAPTVAERRRLTLIGVGTLAAAGAVAGGPLLALLLGAGAPAVARQLLAARDRRRGRRLAAGLPIAARSIADALAGGNSLHAAVSVAAEGVTGPAGDELGRAGRAIALGAHLEEALESLRVRAADRGWDTLVAAILMQRELGGDLAGLLRTVATAAEDGARAEATARTMIAQAKATAQLVTLVPLAGAVITELVRPGTFAGMLGEPVPAALLAGSIVIGVLAVVVISRLGRGLGDGR